MESGRSSWCWGWSGIGALVALGFGLASGLLRRAELAPPGPVVLWAADRDASRLYGLDADLILARSVPLAWPLALARARNGRLYLLRAAGPGAGSARFLDELDSSGSVLRELEVGDALDLDAHAEGALLVVQPAGSAPRVALRIGPDAARTQLAQSAELACVCGSLDSVLVGTRDGRVERLAPDGSGVLASVRVGGSIVDLAPAPEPGAVFALDGAGRRLLRLAPDLALAWQVALPIEARALGADAERVWLVDARAPRVLCYGPGGALELDRRTLPLLGIERALPWLDGAVLLAAPGAILELDARGHAAPGQGGFNYLVDLAR